MVRKWIQDFKKIVAFPVEDFYISELNKNGMAAGISITSHMAFQGCV
jgi:hypothetical protein